MKALDPSKFAIAAAVAMLAGCASMGPDSAMRADTANVLGVAPTDVTILSKHYESTSVGTGYELTTYTVATRTGLTYACTLAAAQLPGTHPHTPICTRKT